LSGADPDSPWRAALPSQLVFHAVNPRPEERARSGRVDPQMPTLPPIHTDAVERAATPVSATSAGMAGRTADQDFPS
jgi:hypothetical protein